MVAVDDWVKWWEKDNFKLTLLKETEKDAELWLLYAISIPYGSEYGRHMGALLVVDKKSREIIAHDVTNDWIHQDQPRKPSVEIESWFDRHVREGLGGIK